MTENLLGDCSPNTTIMSEMLETLFRSAAGGLVVLQSIPNKTIEGAEVLNPVTALGPPITRTRLFQLGHLEEMVATAAKWNAVPGAGVYTSAGLRRDDLEGSRPGKNTDIVSVVALKVDLDTQGAFETALPTLEAVGMAPNLICRTANQPYIRAHLYWLLDTPQTDLEAVRQTEKALALWLKGDRAVTDPRRLMRLAGSVNWAAKEGRTTEVTSLQKQRPDRYDFTDLRNSIMSAVAVNEVGEAASPKSQAEPLGRGFAQFSELITEAQQGESWHLPIRSLTASMAAKGVASENIRAVALSVLSRRAGWGAQAQTDQLDELIRGAAKYDKYSTSQEALARLTPTCWSFVDPTRLPHRRWLYGRRLCRGIVSLTVSPGGVGKSSLAITEALALSTGAPLLDEVLPEGPVRVWYINLEDPNDPRAPELDRRVAAACKHYGITEADIAGRLFIDSGVGTPLKLAALDANGRSFALDKEALSYLAEQIRLKQIDVLIIDPFVSCHDLNENDNPMIDRLAKALSNIAMRENCAIELIHHTKKNGGAEHDAESARGASALIAAARSVRVLNPMTKNDAENAGIPVEQRRSYFRAAIDKQNLAPAAADATWYKMVSIDLGNGPLGIGDKCGVPTRWRWPSATEGIDPGALLRAQEIIGAGNYGQNAQAADWAGHAIAEAIGLNTREKSGRAQVSRLLKLWEAGDYLVVERVPDKRNGKGRERPMLRVGKRADDAEDEEEDDLPPHPEN